MSTSRPVPGYKFPNWAVAYQSVYHAVAGFPSIARRARSLLSPEPPADPNAVALTGVSLRGRAPAEVAADAGAACALPVAGGADAARVARPTGLAVAVGAPADGAPPPPGLASTYPATPRPTTSTTPSATASAGRRRWRPPAAAGVTGPVGGRRWDTLAGVIGPDRPGGARSGGSGSVT